MIRFRTLLCAASAVFGVTLGFGVQAQTQITLSLPTGTSCTFANNTLNCAGGGAGVASCSINGQSSAVIGDTVTLTGSCVDASGATDSALSWTGCGTANGATCTLTSSATVTLTGGAGGSKSKNVTFGAATCSISPQNPSVITGNSQTFSASCNFTPTTYSWTGCTSSQASCTLTPAAGGAVGVTASNGTSTATASTNYTVSAGGGGGAIPGKCDDGNSSVAFAPVTVFNGVTMTKSISNTQTAVIPIVVPAGIARFQLVLFATNPDNTPRNMWLSKTACFTPTAVAPRKLPGGFYPNGAQIAYQVAGGGSFNVTAGAVSGVTITLGNPSSIVMAPGETWYLMVENAVAAGGGCGSGSCTVGFTPNLIN